MHMNTHTIQRVAIVTGAAQGIGLGIVHALLREGYRVAIFDLNSAAIDAAISHAGEYSQYLMGVKVDVTNAASVKDGVAQVSARWKTPDVLVNNAGATRDKRITKMTEEEWDFVIDVNLKS